MLHCIIAIGTLCVPGRCYKLLQQQQQAALLLCINIIIAYVLQLKQTKPLNLAQTLAQGQGVYDT